MSGLRAPSPMFYNPTDPRPAVEAVATAQRAGWPEVVTTDGEEVIVEVKAEGGTKTCALCRRTLPTTEFRKHKGHGDGFDSRCKQCMRVETAAKKRLETGESPPMPKHRLGVEPSSTRRAWEVQTVLRPHILAALVESDSRELREHLVAVLELLA